ncbi:MAG: hypothetical protein KDK10_02780 [Maritimibacter sp.]|nr:hypothetical protein [Maritimibacter sp.]
MTLSAQEFDFATDRTRTTQTGGPRIEETAYGYVIRDGERPGPLHRFTAETGRFFGVILLMAASGLWVLPDSLHGDEFIGIKVAVAIMFLTVGGYFFWIGRHPRHPEFHIDVGRREIRIGQRDPKGNLRTSARLDFETVSSVFVLRSKDHSARPRLFLRLADLDTGLEIAAGSADQLERLRLRLTRDVSGQPAPSVERQLRHHQSAAA